MYSVWYVFRLSQYKTSKCESQYVTTLTGVMHALIMFLTVNERKKNPQETTPKINITLHAAMNSCSLGGGLSIISRPTAF